MWRSEPDLLHPLVIPIHDDPRSPKGIPTDMVLAPLSINVHYLRLLLPWRHCKRICAITAPCTSCSFLFVLSFIPTHVFSPQYKTFQFGDIVVRFSSHITLCVANAI
jgi:hypothetical protein